MPPPDSSPDPDPRGVHFVAIASFGAARPLGAAGSKTWTSETIAPPFAWDELVVSWNADLAEGETLDVSARAIDGARSTRFFSLGRWARGGPGSPRTSAPPQRDADGEVRTDVLALSTPARAAQVRIAYDGAAPAAPLRFVGLSFVDTRAASRPAEPHREAWGATIDVPKRSQLAYPNGAVLCSPTAVSMTLAYWARARARPELDRDVPEVAREVHDPGWNGAGNWAFNAAYAGSFAGMRAYVARLATLAEAEAWIARGVPVVASVAYDLLRERPERRAADGHLLVCVGFTRSGDVVTNDPGLEGDVRRVYRRSIFDDAWAASRRTVYLIYPEDAPRPADPSRHWE